VSYWDEQCRLPSVVLYGSIELGLSDRPANRVHYIQIEYSNPASGKFAGHGRLVVQNEGFHPSTATVECFLRFARRTGIQLLRVYPPWEGDDQVCFLTKGGVAAWFAKDAETGKTSFDTFITDNPTFFKAVHKPSLFARKTGAGRSGRWRDPNYRHGILKAAAKQP
jgi:hypothetical protein